MNKKVLIVTGGTININFFNEIIKKEKFDFIIAVDNGLKILDENNITPNIIVGDFDTASQELINKYKEKNDIEIREFNPIKDNTDTDIAVKVAIEKNATEICILGATGTRIDHVIGNIHILKNALDRNVKCVILDENNEIELIKNKTVIFKSCNDKKYISLIPLTESVENITLRGFKYNLTNGNLKIGSSLGISNEIIEEKAEIKFEKGILIVIRSRD